ncbi:conserved Plasmodium protein, unknown function [Plasmodium berghei]|uniref:Uncharacterized protein n=3 Tax=Plasmodium berghei TaxID=5821 RepID=A0A509ALB9_PLABA|nr:conserved Plasmodium protein, unknown function [Plasmodium berghei ANKA]CXI40096.1 conserved Plasmodium protein, unknown function [Plasmodium berghei]SCN25025.1 conserved Plasmodium protein, unknown function [Plasmodium berghei]SCO60071.1 conserved Plasmodium protein, unknown function [Plasmodium berghei]SCO61562.1 conserved Plasmodium protein, unknown function [Plasmodium berghei]VUC55595.1 conserved Plasmodium protein, unknown function [Plasmodium berghei ANKA]|eukprot:XP_034421405.1 conserved Plasmodium protein, unknown function [Plasmodium berghei ANKA]
MDKAIKSQQYKYSKINTNNIEDIQIPSSEYIFSEIIDNTKDREIYFINKNGNENIEPLNMTTLNEAQKQTSSKKNSINFESLNQNIFRINVLPNENCKNCNDTSKCKSSNQLGCNSMEQKENSNIKNRKKKNIKNYEHDINKINQSDSYSYESDENYIDDINNILKIKTQKIENKNRSTYISQHKERIKDKVKKKKIKYLKNNFLTTNKKSKENIKRASIATIMLQNFSNSDTDETSD